MKHFKFFVGKTEIRLLHIASGLLIVAGFGLLVWFFMQSSHQITSFSEDNNSDSEHTADSCSFHRLFDGICVLTESEVNPKLVAIMIENHLDARPQSGLSRAAVVYEAPVEANYSRFMALFPITEKVVKVGPVRSARPYYLDWAAEYGIPMYMHVGGSPDALIKLKNGDYFDFNQFYRGDYFWRSTDRYAPHNVYTSTDLWTKGWDDYGKNYYSVPMDSWKFGEVAPCTTDCVTSITASFLPPVYEAEWKYSSTTQKYLRYQMGKPHVDQDGTQISAETIVVQRVQTKVLDDELRIEMNTIGTGDALVFTKGNVIKGTWKKFSKSSKTRFYDSSGQEITLTPGKIWIEVVNQVGDIDYR